MRTWFFPAAATVLIAAFVATPAFGQWLFYPTPGVPQTPDGKPDLSAPAPRDRAACRCGHRDGRQADSGNRQRVAPSGVGELDGAK
jgi:hypothetical protein